mmetsp:Transcript_20529/g.51834  ORF Transcript_20529/g.51834 Transcript_20529/m.51834 type:complete len:339 (-) Transcript_20529:2789-3805(-)
MPQDLLAHLATAPELGLDVILVVAHDAHLADQARDQLLQAFQHLVLRRVGLLHLLQHARHLGYPRFRGGVGGPLILLLLSRGQGLVLLLRGQCLRLELIMRLGLRLGLGLRLKLRRGGALVLRDDRWFRRHSVAPQRLHFRFLQPSVSLPHLLDARQKAAPREKAQHLLAATARPHTGFSSQLHEDLLPCGLTARVCQHHHPKLQVALPHVHQVLVALHHQVLGFLVHLCQGRRLLGRCTLVREHAAHLRRKLHVRKQGPLRVLVRERGRRLPNAPDLEGVVAALRSENQHAPCVHGYFHPRRTLQPAVEPYPVRRYLQEDRLPVRLEIAELLRKAVL